MSQKIDPMYYYVCDEDTIEAISYTSPTPAFCGITVVKDSIFINFPENSKIPEYVIVKLSGIRKGRSGRRFIERTKEEMIKNIAFWNSWRDK